MLWKSLSIDAIYMPDKVNKGYNKVEQLRNGERALSMTLGKIVFVLHWDWTKTKTPMFCATLKFFLTWNLLSSSQVKI